MCGGLVDVGVSGAEYGIGGGVQWAAGVRIVFQVVCQLLAADPFVAFGRVELQGGVVFGLAGFGVEGVEVLGA